MADGKDAEPDEVSEDDGYYDLLPPRLQRAYNHALLLVAADLRMREGRKLPAPLSRAQAVRLGLQIISERPEASKADPGLAD
jgi:hypothetical protein